MLTYVAILFLSGMVYGPLKNPDGFNFPESRLFHDSGTLPIILPGTRAHIGFLMALLLAGLMYYLLKRHKFGFHVKVSGESLRALVFSGKSTNYMVYLSFIISGAFAGLAGVIEVSGPVGQLGTSNTSWLWLYCNNCSFSGQTKSTWDLFCRIIVSTHLHWWRGCAN